MIGREIVAFLDSGVAGLLGATGPENEPCAVRDIAAHVPEIGRKVVVFVPRERGAAAIAALRSDPRVAVTFTRPTTHRTVQMKGRVIAMRDAGESRKPVIDAWYERISQELETVGLPRRISGRWVRWPAVELEVEVDAIFLQTPGPDAGSPLAQ